MLLSRTKLLLVLCTLLILSQRWWLPLLGMFINLAALPSRWHSSAALSYISQDQDNFDLTFAAYDVNQSSAGPQYQDVVPPILHHISLGPNPPREEWVAARAECIKYHSDWEAIIWNDENSSKFVAEEFPHLKTMWDSYRFPVERVDALRYMVLQKYGGVVLDFDLACKRSLGPLRRFDFVGPAAHPTGFSIGFMMASPGNSFIRSLVDHLAAYDRAWFFLPYVTVMFSTGCHYASTIFTLQNTRAPFRILGGTAQAPRLHMLNGYVDTPLFRHLGSSSWHSSDAFLINWLGHPRKGPIIVLIVVISFVAGSLLAVCLACRHRKNCPPCRKGKRMSELEEDTELMIKEA
ncbi:putative glycosyl transferase [Talaromyces proteolyticus]|uniref:Glycosyl transferase n=1 Tax=Talaromyces proteolyticus TaxID=1131652 RepID=A0AAD4KP22_9EURO|nr:putative glycosyl transferase [Talaromyces proteolyticus]KAH8695108.1 putative glycosyl transferase [Talaromyces proteolyticus]